MIGIYKIANKIDGKVYVGQSSQIEKRWKKHIETLNKNKHDNQYLQNAWNKYGKDNFIFEVIQEGKDRDELNYWETYWCDYYRPNVYNLQYTGNAHNMSEETRNKISIANKGQIPFYKGKHLTEEHKRKIGISGKGKHGHNKGKHLSQEAKDKISKANKGRKLSEEQKKKIGDVARKTWTGRHHKKESKIKASINNIGKHNKGVPLTQEHRNKISIANKGKNLGEKNGMWHKRPSQKLIDKCSKAVLQLDLDGNVINEFYSIKEASRQLKIGETAIGGVCNHKIHYNTAGGYKFVFKEEYYGK